MSENNNVNENRILEELFRTNNIKNEAKTLIYSSMSSKVVLKTDFAQVKIDKGHSIDSSGNIKEWQLEGTLEEEGKLVFYGPYLEIEPLPEFFIPSKEEFILLRNLFHSIKDQEQARFSPLHIVRLKEGGFLQLPPLLINKLIQARFGQHNPLLHRFCHPDLQGDRGLCYSLALLQFCRFTESYPWLEREEEALNHEIRDRILPSLSHFFPNLENAELIDRSLQANQEKVDLSLWKDIPPMESMEKGPLWDKAMEKSRKVFEGKRDRLKNRKKYILAISGGVLALYILVRLAISIFTPPVTEGLSRREVVELFYENMNRLKMEESYSLVIRKNQVDPHKLMDFTHIIKGMRQVAEGSVIIYSPQEWEQLNRETIRENEILFGVSDLKITDLGENLIQADYILWSMPVEQSAEEADALVPVLYDVVDIIRLEQKKRAWFIHSVKTESRVPQSSE